MIQALGRQLAQLGGDQRQELRGGVEVARPDDGPDVRDVAQRRLGVVGTLLSAQYVPQRP
jgi:hypothetical protein